MEPRINIITLGVADLTRSLEFYRDGLGFRPSGASNEHIAFFQLGGLALALYGRSALAEDARVPDPGPGGGFGGITLAHNVRTREEVDEVLAEIAKAGGRILKPAEDAFWGGRSGYFADPDGHTWEIAHNPLFAMTAAGTVELPG